MDADRPDSSTVQMLAGSPTALSSRRLFAPGETELRIDHDGTEYRLRITKSNKLILNR